MPEEVGGEKGPTPHSRHPCRHRRRRQSKAMTIDPVVARESMAVLRRPSPPPRPEFLKLRHGTGAQRTIARTTPGSGRHDGSHLREQATIEAAPPFPQATTLRNCKTELYN